MAKVEIEIDEDCIPKGWRVVRIGEILSPSDDVLRNGKITAGLLVDDKAKPPFIILDREPPPEVPGWFARGFDKEDDRLLLFSGEPMKCEGKHFTWWGYNGSHACDIDNDHPWHSLKSLLQPGQKIKASDLLKVVTQ